MSVPNGAGVPAVAGIGHEVDHFVIGQIGVEPGVGPLGHSTRAIRLALPSSGTQRQRDDAAV